MKIIIISPAHPLRGGIAASAERLAIALQPQHDVIIYSYALQYPNFLFPGATQYTQSPAPTQLTIKSVINSVQPLNWLQVGNAIKREQPDLVICRFWMPFFAPCLGTILRQVRAYPKATLVGFIDNIIPHEKRFGDTALSRYFLKNIDAAVVMSKSVAAELSTHFNFAKPIRYAPHPVYDVYGDPVSRETALATLGLPTNRRYLLFFGFIRAYKGLDLLLQAMAQLSSPASSEVHLLVAGEFYEEELPYRQLVEDLALTQKVHFFNHYIADEAVRDYFSAADVVVQPYKSATQSGISQIAYHFEKPMIVTNVGGLPEIVPDGEVGSVVAVDSTALAAAIDKFLAHPQSPHQYQAGLRRQKQQYSWEALATTFLALADRRHSTA